MKRALGCVALLLLVASRSADVTAQLSDADGPPVVTFQLGVKGGVVGSLLTEPDARPVHLPVPTFFGLGGGGGLALEALFADMLGLEIDVFFLSASGSGEVRFPGGTKVREHLTSSELHVALLAKLQLAYRVGRPRTPQTEIRAKPYFGLGATFVFQSRSEFTIDRSPFPLDTAIETESYTTLTAAFGVAIQTGPVRLPIELRAQWRPLDDDPFERAAFSPETGRDLTRLAVRSTWEFQFFLLFGVQYTFEVF
jgi:hypothetical protein